MALVVPEVLEESCTTRQALERLASKWRVLLLYALHQRDPVFILGQATGLLIYIRNIMLSQPPAAPSDKPA